MKANEQCIPTVLQVLVNMRTAPFTSLPFINPKDSISFSIVHQSLLRPGTDHTTSYFSSSLEDGKNVIPREHHWSSWPSLIARLNKGGRTWPSLRSQRSQWKNRRMWVITSIRLSRACRKAYRYQNMSSLSKLSKYPLIICTYCKVRGNVLWHDFL